MTIGKYGRMMMSDVKIEIIYDKQDVEEMLGRKL